MHKFKVGDKVRVKSGGRSQSAINNKGKISTIKDFDTSADACHLNDIGGYQEKLGIWFDEIELVEDTPKPKFKVRPEQKFSVGDRVRFLRPMIGGYNDTLWRIGSLGTVQSKIDGYDTSSNCYVKIDECLSYQNGSDSDYCVIPFENLELVEDTPKPKFKVGDRVRMLEKQSTEKKYTSEDNRQGKEGYVIKKINNREGTEYWCYYSKGEHDWIEQQDLELIEEECKSCEVDKPWKVLTQGIIVELGGYEYYKGNEPTTSSIKKGGSIMSKLTSFVKNSLLSADEKLLRKYDLKDSCGDYTSEAEELVMKKLIKDNEAYLIEVATALEAEEKKNK